MASWLYSFIDTFNYFINNSSCIFSTFDFLVSKLLLLFSYMDLLVDLSETFSILIVIGLVLTASISLISHVHELTSTNVASKAVISVSYSNYLKFMQFKFRL